MNQQELLTGTIDRFLFQNSDSDFCVFILTLNRSTSITVKGALGPLQAGQEVQLKGSWIFHPKFGKQFEAATCISILPTSVVGLKKYLGSGLIKGIGASYADKLVSYFGTDILTVIDKHPERLKEVGGIGEKRIERISAAWVEQKEVAHIMVFLQEKGLSPALASRIYKQYRQQSLAVLKENPYRLADELWGIGFKTADEIAQKLGFAFDCQERVTAGIIFTITSASSNGHLYVEIQDLKTKTCTLLGLTLETHQHLIKNGLHLLYDKNKITFITDAGNHYLTLSSYHNTEKSVAEKLSVLLKTPSKLAINTDKLYQQLRAPQEHEVELNDDQQRGIMSCLSHKVTIVTGGPGTGKTTLIKKLLSLLDQERVNYKLAAPTGRAAKRIIEGTGKFAMTIHRLLEMDPGTMKFVHNEHNALKLDYLIIDEASMIDIFLANAIFKALPHTAHLVLIGDIDQLPSVGPGNVLKDLIQSNATACIRLTQIFRQAQNSLIVVNAHRINHGEFPVSFIEGAQSDFKFIKEEQEEEVQDHLKRILFIELPKKGISHDDAIVLTPMNRGALGTVALNHLLQGLLNPEIQDQISVRGTIFKVKDKVMQIRNNYDKHVYNGDIGAIIAVDTEEKQLIVTFSEHKEVVYEFEELHELVLAYAISIHKSQGSEYAAVIVPLFMQHFMLLQRNLIYTALTRAKKICFFIGQPRALAVGLRNTKGTERLTFLKKFINEQMVSSPIELPV